MVVLTVFFAVLLFAGSESKAAKRAHVSVVGSGPGTSIYVMYGGLAGLVSKESKTVEMSNNTTRGAVEDLRFGHCFGSAGRPGPGRPGPGSRRQPGQQSPPAHHPAGQAETPRRPLAIWWPSSIPMPTWPVKSRPDTAPGPTRIIVKSWLGRILMRCWEIL